MGQRTKIGLEATILIILMGTATISIVSKLGGHVEGQYVFSSQNLPPMNLTIIALNGTEMTLNERQIGNMASYESWGGYKNSLGNIEGLGNYTGVPLLALCNLVGGIAIGDSLQVNASDGYSIELSYDQIANGNFIAYDNQTGVQVTPQYPLTAILAYYYDDANITDGPLRLAIVGPEGLVTDSSYWVKYATTLQILNVGIHDVAVTDITTEKSVVEQSYQFNATVTLANVGDFNETLNSLLYANSTFLGVQNLILANGTSGTIVYVNTASMPYGNYTIWDYVTPVPLESDTRNNNRTDGTIFVAMIGDLTGATPFVPDGKCDIRDISLVAKAFGTIPGMPEWNANCDVNNDGKVNIVDISIVAKHFGQSTQYP